MCVNSISKAMVSASLLALSLSAQLLASDSDSIIDRPPNCPTPGDQAPDYVRQYELINRNFTPIYNAFRDFVAVYANPANPAPTCVTAESGTGNGAINDAYIAMVNTVRDIIGCSDGNWSHNTIPGQTAPIYCDYRILLALPDGTVVYDSSKPGPICPSTGPEASGNFYYSEIGQYGNSAYAFSKKIVNENHNTRIAVQRAQSNECGNQWETKFSTSDHAFLNYVAQRLGHIFDNQGTAVVSLFPYSHQDHDPAKK